MNITSDQTCEDLMQFMHRFKAVAVELAEQHGLTMMQVSTMTAISRRGELPMGAVADELHCDASNVTGIVDRLVAQGLIVRCECPSDRRTKALQLTDKGKRVIASIKKQLPERLGCDLLNASERTLLRSILGKLTTA